MTNLYLPPGGIPTSGEEPDANLMWFSSDTRVNFEAKGGHPLYGPNDIVYRLNGHGYRTRDFCVCDDLTTVAIGCSCTFGVGVRADEIYHEIFADRLRRELDRPVTHWNLGIPGASPDYVARMTHRVVQVLDPAVVVVLLPPIERREYFTGDDRKLGYCPNWMTGAPHEAAEGRAFDNLSSKNDDFLNAYRNYKSIRAATRDRVFLYSFAYRTDFGPLLDHLDRDCWVDAHEGDIIDWARDYGHPGPATHRKLADQFWDKLLATGGLESLAGCRAASLAA